MCHTSESAQRVDPTLATHNSTQTIQIATIYKRTIYENDTRHASQYTVSGHPWSSDDRDGDDVKKSVMGMTVVYNRGYPQTVTPKVARGTTLQKRRMANMCH